MLKSLGLQVVKNVLALHALAQKLLAPFENVGSS